MPVRPSKLRPTRPQQPRSPNRPNEHRVRVLPYDPKPVRVTVRVINPFDATEPKAAKSELELASDRNVWSARIAECWRRSLASVVECGRLLREAKQVLAHGEFEHMVDQELPFGPRTAQRLMAMAGHPCITKPTYASHLPGSWDTVYELTRLNEAAFDERIADGSIHPGMTKKEATALRRSLATVSDQLDLFEPSLFCLSSVGRRLEKALRRHAYSQAKLTRNSALIIEAVVISIRALETLVSKAGESDGAAKIEAEFSRLERRVHALMGPCRVPG
jgi:hypothetical protein